MKKKRNLLKKILTAFTTLSILCTASLGNIHATENVPSFEDDMYRIIEANNTVSILDKRTGEEIRMVLHDDNNATLITSSGEEKVITRDTKGNVYLDNELAVESPLTIDETRNGSIALRGGKYHYFQTTYYDTKTQGDLQSLALALFGFMPYVGTLVSIISIIQSARNIGAETLYVKVDHYYIDGYSMYKYENYFYTNKERTKLLKHTTEYKRMW